MNENLTNNNKVLKLIKLLKHGKRNYVQPVEKTRTVELTISISFDSTLVEQIDSIARNVVVLEVGS